MSIIYDALKKVQKANQPAPGPDEPLKSKPKPKFTQYVIYLLIICVGMAAAKIIFDYLAPSYKAAAPQAVAPSPNPPVSLTTQSPKESPQKTPKKTAESALITSGQEPDKTNAGNTAELVLNGVFFSQGQGYCLINNQISKVGDEVNGATVLNITIDGVELKRQEEILKLSTRSK